MLRKEPVIKQTTIEGYLQPTLTSLLVKRATSTPDRLAYTYLGKDGPEVEFTDAGLDKRARIIAARLQTIAKPGDRALLAFPPGLDFLAAFFGCLYAGVLAVPTTYPRPRRPTHRYEAIARDSQAVVGLTNDRTINLMNKYQDSSSIGPRHWIAVDQLDQEPPSTWSPYPAQRHDVAFLQYTSGSTNDPKGVMVTHGNLMQNLEIIRQGFGIDAINDNDPNRVGVFWLPVYHDMGLIGSVLTTLYTRRHAVLMSPVSFIQKPLRWLQAISDYQASISGAPNFAYELCIQRTTVEQREKLNLSSWELAFCGAEPISTDALNRFADAFKVSRFERKAFYPCYGLTEATLMVTGADGAKGINNRKLNRAALSEHRVEFTGENGNGNGQCNENGHTVIVNCGKTHCGHKVEIVHPSKHTRCDTNEVGEIWVRGDCVAKGYWNRAEETNDVFNARISGCNESHTYLRTGDLGFLVNEELFVTGRLKDMLIIRGQNHYPQDIENTAGKIDDELLPGLAAAFSLNTPKGEQPIVIQEIDIRRIDNIDLEKITRTIRIKVALEHEINLSAVALISQASLPRTSSGKVQRNMCKQKYVRGELNILHHWQQDSSNNELMDFPKLALNPASLKPSNVKQITQTIEQQLIGWLQRRENLPTDQVTPDRPFAELGIDSVIAVELSYHLEQWLNIELSPVVAWNFQTPAKMAEYLACTLCGTPLNAATNNSTPETINKSSIEDLLGEIESMSPNEVYSAISDKVPN